MPKLYKILLLFIFSIIVYREIQISNSLKKIVIYNGKYYPTLEQSLVDLEEKGDFVEFNYSDKDIEFKYLNSKKPSLKISIKNTRSLFRDYSTNTAKIFIKDKECIVFHQVEFDKNIYLGGYKIFLINYKTGEIFRTYKNNETIYYPLKK